MYSTTAHMPQPHIPSTIKAKARVLTIARKLTVWRSAQTDIVPKSCQEQNAKGRLQKETTDTKNKRDLFTSYK